MKNPPSPPWEERHLLRHWVIEIVRTQMAKTDVFVLRRRGNDVADFDLVVGDDHAIDQQLHELMPLLEGGRGAPALHARTELRHPGRHTRHLRLGGELTLLAREGLVPLIAVAAAALVFVERDDAAQVGVRQALPLLLDARSPLA